MLYLGLLESTRLMRNHDPTDGNGWKDAAKRMEALGERVLEWGWVEAQKVAAHP
jgi:hypothetical protein